MEVAQVKLTCWNKDVYEPSDDTFVLTDVLQEYAPTWATSKPRCCVELGCGSGYVICSLALLLRQQHVSSHLLAVDHSAAAVDATRQTLSNHNLAGIDVINCSLLGPLEQRLQGVVDVLVFNPPYVPTPDSEVGQMGIASAWAGGYKGRRVIDQVLPKLPALLSKEGELFLVTVSENDPQGIISEMQRYGFTGRILGGRQADEESLSIVHLKRVPNTA